MDNGTGGGRQGGVLYDKMVEKHSRDGGGKEELGERSKAWEGVHTWRERESVCV